MKEKSFITIKKDKKYISVPDNKSYTITREINEKSKKYIINYNNIKYDWEDPDACNIELYKTLTDVLDLMFNEELEVFRNNKECCIHIKINNREYILTSDYIGFSKNWVPHDIEDEMVSEALKITRTIGGHVAWPIGVGYPTINQAKGTGQGFYDRIDWTLRILSIYYKYINEDTRDKRYKFIYMDKEIIEIFSEGKEKEFLNINFAVCQMIVACENAREWFEEFHEFKNFIDVFKLNMLCDIEGGEYVVKPIINWFPIKPSDYRLYINNMKKCIEDRTNTINNMMNLNRSKDKIIINE